MNERNHIVQQHVEKAGLQAEIRELPQSTHTAAAAAAALGCEVGAIASSLLFLVDDEPVLVMTSGAHRVDPQVLARNLEAERVELAPAKQVKTVTGQAIGGVAPTGHPSKITTVVDRTLRDYEQIWTAAGTPNTVMPMTFDDLVALTEATVVTVA